MLVNISRDTLNCRVEITGDYDEDMGKREMVLALTNIILSVVRGCPKCVKAIAMSILPAITSAAIAVDAHGRRDGGCDW